MSPSVLSFGGWCDVLLGWGDAGRGSRRRSVSYTGVGYPRSLVPSLADACLKPGVAWSGLPIGASRVPADFGARRLPTRAGTGCQLGLWGSRGGPAEAGELACARDGDHVPGLLALAHPLVQAVEPGLGAAGDLQDVVGQPLLALVERLPDPGWAGVMPAGLDEDPPRVLRAGLRDRPVPIGPAGLLAGGHQPQPGAELHRAREPGEVADLEHDDQRRERVDPAERAEPADQRPELRVGRDVREPLVERVLAGTQPIARGEVVDERQLGVDLLEGLC